MPFINHEKPREVCRSSDHTPPTMIVLPAGTHTWECPICGEITTFTVPDVSM